MSGSLSLPKGSNRSRPLRTLADEMTSQAIDEAIALGAAAQNPAWSNIGL